MTMSRRMGTLSKARARGRSGRGPGAMAQPSTQRNGVGKTSCFYPNVLNEDRVNAPGRYRPPSAGMNSSGELDDGASFGEHFRVTDTRVELDSDAVAVELLDDLATHLKRRTFVVVRHGDRRGEANAVLDDGARVARPVRDDPTGLGHREHAVRDDVRQPDRLRDAFVPMDDVEVAGRTGVLDEVRALHLEGLRGKSGADLDVVVLHRGGHAVAPSEDAAVPRETMLEYASATSSPSTVVIVILVVINSLRPASRMSATDETTFSTSPARTGRRSTNRCSPWTTSE